MVPPYAFLRAVPPAGQTKDTPHCVRQRTEARLRAAYARSKPRRTALLANAGYAGTSGQGTLQWTYVWSGTAYSSSGERSLQIDFTAKAADQWAVNGWNWSLH